MNKWGTRTVTAIENVVLAATGGGDTQININNNNNNNNKQIHKTQWYFKRYYGSIQLCNYKVICVVHTLSVTSKDSCVVCERVEGGTYSQDFVDCD